MSKFSLLNGVTVVILVTFGEMHLDFSVYNISKNYTWYIHCYMDRHLQNMPIWIFFPHPCPTLLDIHSYCHASRCHPNHNCWHASNKPHIDNCGNGKAKEDTPLSQKGMSFLCIILNNQQSSRIWDMERLKFWSNFNALITGRYFLLKIYTYGVVIFETVNIIWDVG